MQIAGLFRQRVPRRSGLPPAGVAAGVGGRHGRRPPGPPRRSTSPAGRRRSSSPRTARSAWSASPPAPTPPCPTRPRSRHGARYGDPELRLDGPAREALLAALPRYRIRESREMMEQEVAAEGGPPVRRDRRRGGGAPWTAVATGQGRTQTIILDHPADGLRQVHAIFKVRGEEGRRATAGSSPSSSPIAARAAASAWSSAARPRRPAHGARQRGTEHRVLLSANGSWTCCPTRRTSTSACTTRRTPKTRRRRPAQPPDESPQLRGPGQRRRRVRRLRREERAALGRQRHRGLHAPRSSTPKPTGSTPRPTRRAGRRAG